MLATIFLTASIPLYYLPRPLSLQSNGVSLTIDKMIEYMNNIPDDLDTTALALTVLPPDSGVITSMLDKMMEYLNPDGTIQVRPCEQAILSSHELHHPKIETLCSSINVYRYTLIVRRFAPTPSPAQMC